MYEYLNQCDGYCECGDSAPDVSFNNLKKALLKAFFRLLKAKH